MEQKEDRCEEDWFQHGAEIQRSLREKNEKRYIGVLYTRTSYTIVTEAMWVFGVQRVLNGLV